MLQQLHFVLLIAVFTNQGCDSPVRPATGSDFNATAPATGPDEPILPAELGGEPMTNITVSSTAFGNGEKVPVKFTGDGEDVSPPLAFSGLPQGVKELALICDDPDAPTPQPWVHWVIYKIPATADGLPENVAKVEKPAAPQGALQGKNSWDTIGYRGPAPPKGHGVHHYHFKVFALDITLDAAAGLTKDALLRAMQGHILA